MLSTNDVAALDVPSARDLHHEPRNKDSQTWVG